MGCHFDTRSKDEVEDEEIYDSEEEKDSHLGKILLGFKYDIYLNKHVKYNGDSAEMIHNAFSDTMMKEFSSKILIYPPTNSEFICELYNMNEDPFKDDITKIELAFDRQETHVDKQTIMDIIEDAIKTKHWVSPLNKSIPAGKYGSIIFTECIVIDYH